MSVINKVRSILLASKSSQKYYCWLVESANPQQHSEMDVSYSLQDAQRAVTKAVAKLPGTDVGYTCEIYNTESAKPVYFSAFCKNGIREDVFMNTPSIEAMKRTIATQSAILTKLKNEIAETNKRADELNTLNGLLQKALHDMTANLEKVPA